MAVFPETVQPTMLSVPVQTLKMPPPCCGGWATLAPVEEAFRPLAIVSPEMVTSIAGVTLPMLKTRATLLPLTVSTPAPGPVMVRFLSMAISPVVSAIMPATANSIVSPAVAAAMEPRSEPKPESFVFVTVMTAARAGSSNNNNATASPAQKRRHAIEGIAVKMVEWGFISP